LEVEDAMNHPVPVVFFSRCLGFDRCRWNGEVIRDVFIAALAAKVEAIHECPEMAVGLGCPRDPIRMVKDGAELELLQPATGRKVGAAMREFSASYLASLPPLDGYLLKSRSPSCGWKDVKVYDTPLPGSAAKPGRGLFGEAVLARGDGLPVEDEGRLKNFALREHFLGAVWTFARFRQVEAEKTMAALVRFHTVHKLFFLMHNQKEMRLLGKLVANNEGRDLGSVLAEYRKGLGRALASPPKYGSLINTIQHAFGGFSESLSAEERAFFVEMVEQYRDERIPASVLLRLVKSWALRFGEKYLLEQILFEPFPLELVDLADSGNTK
jgi:uncharacterized protein YbgA (DUF1722 family)/uncharacterized protein YbbK (DUF523 family)